MRTSPFSLSQGICSYAAEIFISDIDFVSLRVFLSDFE